MIELKKIVIILVLVVVWAFQLLFIFDYKNWMSIITMSLIGFGLALVGGKE